MSYDNETLMDRLELRAKIGKRVGPFSRTPGLPRFFLNLIFRRQRKRVDQKRA